MQQRKKSDVIIENDFNHESNSESVAKPNSEPVAKSNGDSVVQLNKHLQPEEKQNSESSIYDQVLAQLNIPSCTRFDEKYAQLWDEAGKENALLSLLICEVDCFKDYHDNYGHQGASFMLVITALTLKATSEKNGCYLGRYKDNKFGILIKGGDTDAANEIASEIRLAVEKSKTEHKHSSVSNIVTVTIGLSSFYPTSMDLLMEHAATALVSAKTDGHNQVVDYLDSGLIQSAPSANDEKIANELLQQQKAQAVALKQQIAKQEAEAAALKKKQHEAMIEEQLKQNILKQDALKLEQLKQEQLKLEQLKQDALIKEQLKKEQLRLEKLKEDALKEEQLRYDSLKLEKLKAEQVKLEQLKKETLKKEQLKQEQSTQDSLLQKLKKRALRQNNIEQKAEKEEALKQEKLKKEKLKKEKLAKEMAERKAKKKEKVSIYDMDPFF